MGVTICTEYMETYMHMQMLPETTFCNGCHCETDQQQDKIMKKMTKNDKEENRMERNERMNASMDEKRNTLILIMHMTEMNF